MLRSPESLEIIDHYMEVVETVGGSRITCSGCSQFYDKRWCRLTRIRHRVEARCVDLSYFKIQNVLTSLEFTSGSSVITWKCLKQLVVPISLVIETVGGSKVTCSGCSRGSI